MLFKHHLNLPGNTQRLAVILDQQAGEYNVIPPYRNNINISFKGPVLFLLPLCSIRFQGTQKCQDSSCFSFGSESWSFEKVTYLSWETYQNV